MYVDQIQHDLGTLDQVGSDRLKTARDLMSAAHTNFFGYRVMEALRNHAQHRGVPVHRVRYPMNTEERSVGRRLRTRVIPCLEPWRLRDDEKFSKPVLVELEKRGEQVPLTPLVREYIEGLASVQEGLRSATDSDVEAWEALLKRAHERVAPVATDTPPVSLVTIDAGGKVVEEVHIFTDLFDYRDHLSKRNSVLQFLSARYVSGEDDP